MSSKSYGWSLLVALPDDLFAMISKSLSPKDICNLSLCCRSLNSLAASDKVWLPQCEVVGMVPTKDLLEWRKAVVSYKVLCRFLISVEPLMGIWVHQNPELGNVVYVMPGFVSVVGCRIIPQELGPLGIEDGPILWAPVFEVVCDEDGSIAFFLHGRESDTDNVYPGSVKSIDKSCNVLLLEAEPRKLMDNNANGEQREGFSLCQDGGEDLVRRRSFRCLDVDLGRKVSRSDSAVSRPHFPFSKLSFGNRRKLLEIVTCQVRLKVSDSLNTALFPCLRDDEVGFQREMTHLCERRAHLIKLHRLERERNDWTDNDQVPRLPTQLDLTEIKKTLDRGSRRRSFGEYLRNSIKQMLRGSSTTNGDRGLMISGSSITESKHAQLHEFLSSGSTIGLTLHASTMKLSSYRAWPSMHSSRFALYKLPVLSPIDGKEYSGLWGGTFGWPPGRSNGDNKPGKALFVVVLSYHDELPRNRLLIATKILEGTHYVLHPNGSAMFVVDIDEPSEDPFPWNTGADSLPVDVKCAFTGEGIANGYGFRYPGSKPGSLFELQDGMLAFVWQESGAVLTLQRLKLQDLLRKGEQVPVLPPIANFSYLTKSYSNVFANMAAHSSSSRRGQE